MSVIDRVRFWEKMSNGNYTVPGKATVVVPFLQLCKTLAGPNCEKPGPSKEEQALESAESH